MGLLRKQYGYIKDNAELEYQTSAKLAKIVSSKHEIMIKKIDIRTIAFIARYGQPLLTKNKESQIVGKGEKYGNDTDRYSDSRLSRCMPT